VTYILKTKIPQSKKVQRVQGSTSIKFCKIALTVKKKKEKFIAVLLS